MEQYVPVLFDTNFQSGIVLAEHDCYNFVSGMENFQHTGSHGIGPVLSTLRHKHLTMLGVCHRNTNKDILRCDVLKLHITMTWIISWKELLR